MKNQVCPLDRLFVYPLKQTIKKASANFCDLLELFAMIEKIMHDRVKLLFLVLEFCNHDIKWDGYHILLVKLRHLHNIYFRDNTDIA